MKQKNVKNLITIKKQNVVTHGLGWLSTFPDIVLLSHSICSISILSIFKIIKKQVIELKKKKIYLSSFFTDWENDKIGEVDEHNLFQICVTYGSTIGSENIA